jgi:transcriptional regulator with XRE-family HTH domain
MVLLRRVIGDALRARRQAQQRTLREVSTAANVSLGYLSEIERGQKEASSELLAAICGALGAALSDVLREVSETLADAAQVDGGVALRPRPVDAQESTRPEAAQPEAAKHPKAPEAKMSITDGNVSVAVRHDGPLKTTLRATRNGQGREVVRAA